MAKPKLSTILWVLVTVVLIVIIVALANSLNDTKTALTQKEEELVALQSEKDSVEAELERTRQDKMDLEDKIYAMDMEISKLTEDLEDKSGEISELSGNLDQARVDLEETQSSLEREMQEKNALAVEVIKTKQDLETNQSILDEIRAAKEALEAKVKQLMAEKEVALERIVVTPEAEPLRSAVELEGEVLVVNRDFNFVVIDLGKQNGIQVGMKFDVYKDDEVVGQVEVEKIYDTMAAATILSETKKGIAKGREVRSI